MVVQRQESSRWYGPPPVLLSLASWAWIEGEGAPPGHFNPIGTMTESFVRALSLWPRCHGLRFQDNPEEVEWMRKKVYGAP